MAQTTNSTQVVAFEGVRLIASGDILDVATLVRAAAAVAPEGPIFVFDAVTSAPVEIDLRDPVAIDGASDHVISMDDSSDRLADIAGQEVTDDGPRGPGRPRLGVVSREVTLLPRHWDWLATQSGGASAALRRLVDEARAAYVERDRIRRAQEHAYRFTAAMLGDHPGFEEATRALFAGDRDRFSRLSDPWPPDLRDHARRLASAAFAD